MPHETAPPRWPQADYFQLALVRTRTQATRRMEELRLRSDARPDLLVLPVQTQAFGFAPPFRAVIGAELDRLVGAPGVARSRQTDWADAIGPFRRRIDDGEIDTLERRYPGATLIVLYLGHDGAGNAFLTLMRRVAGKSTLAHRSLPLPDAAVPAYDVIAPMLPAMLKELQVSISERGTEAPIACEPKAWMLADLEPGVPRAERVCHALGLGTLLPDFELLPSAFGPLATPRKLAWLAAAYAEAGGGAIRELASHQLGFERLPYAALAVHARSADPVVAPVARLLGSATRGAAMPLQSVRDARQRDLDQAAAGLDSQLRPVFVERGWLDEPSRPVDWCAIEAEYPVMKASEGCRMGAPRTGPLPSRARQELFEEWRLVRGYKDLQYLGRTLADPAGVAAALKAMPPDVAAHPFVRQSRFAYVALAEADLGSFEARLARLRAAATDFVATTVELQSHGSWLAGYSLAEHAWSGNAHISSDPEVRAVSLDERRLLLVLRFDAFASPELGPSRREAGQPAYFLGDEAALYATLPMLTSKHAPAAGTPAAPPPEGVFAVDAEARLGTPSLEQRQQAVDRSPAQMKLRVELALALAKEGRPRAAARSVIDAYPRDLRADQRIRESHAQALPAHAFYFAGELDAARVYYERTAQIGTGSESDVVARARLRQIDGDLAGMQQATLARLERYPSDFARRDLAGLAFIRGRRDEGWSWLEPRLANADTFGLWVGAMVGHRQAGAGMAQVRDWIASSRLEQAQIGRYGAGTLLLHAYAVTDRIPSDADILLLRQRPYSEPLAESAELVQMALAGQFDAARVKALRARLLRDDLAERLDNNALLPLYAWVAQQAGAGKDEELGRVRGVTLQASFRWLLAKAAVMSLESGKGEALAFLRAARVELARIGLGELDDAAFSAPYQYALIAYLMHERTGERAYRDEALDFVRAYRRVFPFLAWIHAMEAALDPSGAAALQAACRASQLDVGSLMLARSGLAARTDSKACARAWAG